MRQGVRLGAVVAVGGRRTELAASSRAQGLARTEGLTLALTLALALALAVNLALVRMLALRILALWLVGLRGLVRL